MKRLLLVGICVLALAACGGSEDGTATAVPSSSAAPGAQQAPQTLSPTAALPPVVIEPENSAEVPAVPTADVPQSQLPPVAACLDLGSPVVSDAVASLPSYFDGVPWIATEMGEPCASFTWVEVDVEGATASSPRHVLFFAGGEYLGTATAEPYAFTSVQSQTPDTVSVGYRWLVGDDPNANPTGGPAVVRYQWDDVGVTMLDGLPPEVTG